MQTTALQGGFADAPIDAAHAFRAAMNAMARPGAIEPISGGQPPAPVSVAAGSLILTLCDADTGLALCGACDTPEMRDWVTFHTSAPLVPLVAADFVLGAWGDLLPLDQYRIGTPEYPDRSATLIVEVDVLQASGATLRGPGIRDAAHLTLPDPSAMAANAMLYPLGLDFFLTCGDRVAALPRSTQISEG